MNTTTKYIIYREERGREFYQGSLPHNSGEFTSYIAQAKVFEIIQDALDLIQMQPSLRGCKICIVQTTYHF